MKKRVSLKQQPKVQIFSQTTFMKFRPKSIKASQELFLKTNKSKQILESQSLMSQISDNTIGKKITLIIELMQHHFLIGNQNQLDMISVGGRINQFVDTQYYWSLNINGPIQLVEIDPKKSLIVIYSNLKILLFSFNNKKKHELPVMILSYEVKSEVKFIRFPNEQCLAVFYQKHFQVYNLNESFTEMKKISNKKYGTKENFNLLDVPPSADGFINVFFEQPKKNQTFGLWSINITFDLIKIRIGTAVKIYDIMKKFKKVLEIKNFSKDVILINLGYEVIAAKKGFIIDSANVNIKNEKSYLRYVGYQKLLHITNNRAQVYSFKVNLSTVPNRINLKAVDSLQLGQISAQSVFLAASVNKDSNITVFFQNNEINHPDGQIQYWFKTSYSIQREKKVKKLFNYGKEISTLDNQTLQKKYDIAQKMGLSKKEIYLEIWNRSGKSSVEDYKFLLATSHYKTIRSEIQNKLRKHTMSYRELLKIQKSCYQMLYQRVFNVKNKCSQEDLQDFLTSHYYLKKLNLLKQIKLLRKKDQKTPNKDTNNPQNENVITIDIQQYSTYKQFQLKQFILDEVVQFCFRQKHLKVDEIRHTFKQFRFVIKMFYADLLRNIIHTAKTGLLKLLSAMPQLLPYQHILTNQDNPYMYSGVWSQITNFQWSQNFYLDNIITIQNKQLITQFIDSIWFKRNERIYHILVPKRKQQIIEINQSLNSGIFFYIFLSQIFQSYDKGLYQLSYISQMVDYLENHFQLYPEHLKSNVFLYFQLYKYYRDQQEWKLPKMNLEAFFKQKDYQLFRYFFDLQKIKKNCILKQIKPIYKKLHTKGNEMFNEGLLSYFDSDVSQLSDLKYLLNRINNEKAQFHEQNLSMYQILLKAMEMKIRIGTGQKSQISISQVLLYVQNIPTNLLLNEENKNFTTELGIIKNIHKHQKILKSMNLNMTIQYMLKRCQDVILKMIDFQIDDKKLFQLRNYQNFKQTSIQILQQIKKIKQNIYGSVYPNLALFAFATAVLQRQQFIQHLSKVFQEQKIKQLFQFDITFRENLVIYAYKWKFSQQSVFIRNSNYLHRLFILLPQQNDIKRFLECQLRLAVMFSQKLQTLQYPISANYIVPKVFELQEIISFLSKEHIQKIDFNEVCTLLNTMYSIQKNQKNQSKPYITLQKIYQLFIQRLLKEPNSFIQCLDILRYYLALKEQNYIKDSNNKQECLDQLSAYLSIFYAQIHHELNQESRQKMTELLSYLFKQPLQLIQIFQHILKQKRTGLQTAQYLTKVAKQVQKRNLLNFDPNNPLIHIKITNQAKNKNTSPSILNKIVKNSLQNMKVQKQIFKNNQIYSILFFNLCHSPLNCLTILRFYKQKIKYKQLRAYISYLSQQIVFNQCELMECFVIVFDVLLKNYKYNSEFQTILHQNYFKNIQDKKDILRIFKQVHKIQIFQIPEEQYYKKLLKSLKRFLRKRNFINNPNKSRKKTINKVQQIQALIQNQSSIDVTRRSRAKRHQKNYPYSDSDYADDDEVQPVPPKILRRRRKYMKVDFDCQNQRLKMLKRSDQDLTQYLANSLDCKINPIITTMQVLDDDRSQKSSAGLHKFKLTQRKKSVQKDRLKQVHEQQKSKYKVNRSLGIESVPAQYIAKHNMSANHQSILQVKRKNSFSYNQIDNDGQEYAQFQRKGTFNSLNSSQQHIPIAKSMSKHSSRQIDSINVEEIKINLLKNVHNSQLNSIKVYDLKLLMKIKQKNFDEEQQKFSQFLKQLIKNIFESQNWLDSQRLNLINQIVKKYSNLTKFCNKKMLQIYLRYSTLKKSYEILLDTNELFGYQGLTSDMTDGSHLYSQFQQNILLLMNDQNAIKLSRLLALTLRKNSLQQQMIYSYFIKKLKNIAIINHGIIQQKEQILLRKIIFSMSIKRFNDSFQQILGIMKQYSMNQAKIKQTYKKIIDIILQSIQSKGDYRSQTQLKKKYNL